MDYKVLQLQGTVEWHPMGEISGTEDTLLLVKYPVLPFPHYSALVGPSLSLYFVSFRL